ncbi:DUF3524 domain-containing protein [Oceanicoccus sp. KOV_DT_Chl]|uniref:tRNA-queuosine alpha-mannosyltransferase domain-containing protein n=1 Tax=Oceanicoccus sp. KOV_DT_Chl TaxID=1904639 RepID=UPI000C7A42B5|nr:DUF3524 domain-containing protein [Oceanicoccus sp. KOV_DT_Chl]
MKILLLSAYDAESHRRWYQTLMAAFVDIEWTVLALPPRYFSWRLRGNSLSWAFGQRQVLEGEYDLVLATSMVDLSALRGFVPHLAAIPTIVYFHENQFAYPANEQQFASIEPRMLNIYTALAADTIVFNSAYNRDTFLIGAGQLLAKMPDQVPAGLVQQLTARSQIIPVPIRAVSPLAERIPNQRLQVLWNHRWEYDKGPDRLLSAVKLLVSRQANVDLHIVGQQFRQQPAAMAELKTLLEQQQSIALKHWGYIEEPAEYGRCLAAADVVLSTAVHDFQGLSVLEAVAAGCIPLVPDRLCYTEWFSSDYLYLSDVDAPAKEAEALVSRLLELIALKQQQCLPEPPALEPLLLSSLIPVYKQLFSGLLKEQGSTK